MSVAEKILEKVGSLPREDQAEVLDFVLFVETRKARREERDLKEFSLDQAMRGMEDEPDLYSISDIREPIK